MGCGGGRVHAGLRWMLAVTYLGKAIRATVQDSGAAMLMGSGAANILTMLPAIALSGSRPGDDAVVFVLDRRTEFRIDRLRHRRPRRHGSIEGALLGGVIDRAVDDSYYIALAFGQMFFILFLLV